MHVPGSLFRLLSLQYLGLTVPLTGHVSWPMESRLPSLEVLPAVNRQIVTLAIRAGSKLTWLTSHCLLDSLRKFFAVLHANSRWQT